MQAGYALRRKLLGLLRIPTRGTKVMLFNHEGELMLVRNSYGDRSLFVLPGGGVGGRETPAAAAAREICEELGITMGALEVVGTYRSEAEGKRDTVTLFRATTTEQAVSTNREIDEAAFFPLGALPATTSAATLRRVAELRGDRVADGRW